MNQIIAWVEKLKILCLALQHFAAYQKNQTRRQVATGLAGIVMGLLLAGCQAEATAVVRPPIIVAPVITNTVVLPPTYTPVVVMRTIQSDTPISEISAPVPSATAVIPTKTAAPILIPTTTSLPTFVARETAVFTIPATATTLPIKPFDNTPFMKPCPTKLSLIRLEITVGACTGYRPSNKTQV